MDIILVIEYVGIASASLSGFLFAVKKDCDWLGAFVAAFLTALGGGIVRDVLVGRDVYSFTNYMPISIVIVMLFISHSLKFHHKREELEKKFIFIFADAIDVICFSIVGSMVALEYGYNVFGVVMIAFCNGVGGGILRDILLNEIPWFLRTGLYGTISMFVGFCYFLLHYFGYIELPFVLTLLALGLIMRMVAYYRGWKLPDL
ncbi:TRIC cation channel family protein [Campylobacter sp. faydin G-24]|uniref:TRIC cation channel family protein n=1 Tax=Campylobacter anatolicus TaxID=2829105 RepID=A0ABS5HHC8_9BACT|nr:TRIC cation channel family protein [Campylobacter anatolicus]MBR8463679.1 TRIC cation channel family protein [Campylobacter anatolicus]MBR8466408.1 TRIC cation channel family protein [Campylobacter anatolicus]